MESAQGDQAFHHSFEHQHIKLVAVSHDMTVVHAHAAQAQRPDACGKQTIHCGGYRKTKTCGMEDQLILPC